MKTLRVHVFASNTKFWLQQISFNDFLAKTGCHAISKYKSGVQFYYGLERWGGGGKWAYLANSNYDYH